MCKMPVLIKQVFRMYANILHLMFPVHVIVWIDCFANLFHFVMNTRLSMRPFNWTNSKLLSALTVDVLNVSQ